MGSTGFSALCVILNVSFPVKCNYHAYYQSYVCLLIFSVITETESIKRTLRAGNGCPKTQAVMQLKKTDKCFKHLYSSILANIVFDSFF